jgi:prepilin-type N-terminal cleavage/methylation domain-containing protein/prepilin-type processing-associated H-X9-DG protein
MEMVFMFRRAFGFTLIELLVVIAIIAILAAILFPVFAKARQKAQSSTCLSNLKEITLSNIMYDQDYDDNYAIAGTFAAGGAALWPWATTWGFTNSYTGVAWPWVLQPYIKNTKLYSDPSQGDSKIDYMYNITDWCTGTYSMSYAYQSPMGPEILSPAQRIMFTCGEYGATGGGYYGCDIISAANYAYSYLISQTPSATFALTWAPHNNGNNCSFFDGHVAWEAMEYLGNAANNPIMFQVYH